MPHPLKHGIEKEQKAQEQHCNYLKHSGHPVKTFPSGFVVNPNQPSHSLAALMKPGMVIGETA